MRHTQLTFDTAWKDDRNHWHLNWLADEERYRFSPDELTEWKMESIDNAVDTFDPSRGTKFTTYLVHCARNKYRMLRRKRNQERRESLRPVKPLHAFRKALRDFERGEVVADVQEILAMMDERDAALLYERHGLGRTIPALMLDYGMTKRQVEYAVKQAVKRFAELWRRNGR